jgi:hypothetical protein
VFAGNHVLKPLALPAARILGTCELRAPCGCPSCSCWPAPRRPITLATADSRNLENEGDYAPTIDSRETWDSLAAWPGSEDLSNTEV